MASETAERLRLYTLLSNHPNWAEILKEALVVEAQKEREYAEKGYGQYYGWEFYDVHCYPPQALFQMVGERILDITMSTRSGKYFRVRDSTLVGEALKALEGPPTAQEEATEAPWDLFEVIVGHDRLKWAFQMALAAVAPVHILLVGPVATAKTLFLGELARLPGSRYVLGSAFSKAGLVDYLLELQPRYLLIDELEKSDGRDLAALLSLMQTGIVTRLKKAMREQVTLQCWVFAAANSLAPLPQEIRSRFLVFHLPEYTEAEFRQVACSLLVKEGVDATFAAEVVEATVPHTRDVRDVVKIARLCRTETDVGELVGMMWPKRL